MTGQIHLSERRSYIVLSTKIMRKNYLRRLIGTHKNRLLLSAAGFIYLND